MGTSQVGIWSPLSPSPWAFSATSGPLAKGRPRALLLAHSPQRLSELWGWAGQQGLNLHLASHFSLGFFLFLFLSLDQKTYVVSYPSRDLLLKTEPQTGDPGGELGVFGGVRAAQPQQAPLPFREGGWRTWGWSSSKWAWGPEWSASTPTHPAPGSPQPHKGAGPLLSPPRQHLSHTTQSLYHTGIIQAGPRAWWLPAVAAAASAG